MRRTWDPTVLAILLAVAILAGSVAATGGLAPGEWKGKLEAGGGAVHLSLRAASGGSDVRTSFSVEPDELEGFDAAAFERGGEPLHLTLRRSAGTFVLEGEAGRRPRGSFRFDADPGFVDGWRALGFEELEERDLMVLAMHDVRLAEAQRLHQLGYAGFDARDMIRLSDDPGMVEWVEGTQGLTPRPDLDDLFRLRAHGVEPETIRAFADAGLGTIEVDALIRLRNHGIDAGYLRGMIEAGVDADDLEGVVRLHAHSVSPDEVAQLRAAGLPGIGIDEQVRLKGHGVEAAFVRGMVESGLPELSIDDILRLFTHGVETDFARALVASGPGKEGTDAVIFLHNHGVSADWAREMGELGYGGVSSDDLARLLAHGVSPKLVRSLGAAGHRELTVDDLIRAATRGPESLGRSRIGSGDAPGS